MALGTNYARGSRKNDMRNSIAAILYRNGFTDTDVKAALKPLKWKSVREIHAALVDVREEFPSPAKE